MNRDASPPSMPRLPAAGLLTVCAIFGLCALPLYQGAVRLWVVTLCLAPLTGALLYTLTAVRRGGPLRWPLDEGMVRAVLAFIAFFLLSALFSRIRFLSILELVKLCGMTVVFASVFLLTASSRKFAPRFVLALAFLGAALSMMGLVQLVNGLPKDWWHKAHFLSSVYVNHNHFAGLIEAILPLTLGLIFAEEDKAKRVFLIFLAGLMGIAFLFSLSRGGFASLTVAVLFMIVILVRRKHFSGAGWVVGSILLVAVSALFLFGVEPIVERLYSVKKIFSEGEPFDRKNIWFGAVRLILSAPILGTGPGTFEFAFLEFRPRGFSGRPVFAHNDYLELLADCGVFAAVAVGWLVFRLLHKGLMTIRTDPGKTRSGIAAGGVTALLSILLHSLIDFNFHIPANAMVFSAVAGILAGGAAGATPSFSKAQTLFWRVWVPAAAALFIAGGALFGLSDYFKWSGSKAFNKGDARRAHASLNRAAFLAPWDAEVFFWRGHAALAMAASEKESGNVKELSLRALRDYSRAARYNPLEPYMAYHWAKLTARFVNPSKMPELAERFAEAARRDPNDAELQYLCGSALLAANTNFNPEAERTAKTILREAFQQDPKLYLNIFKALWEYHRNLADLEAFFKIAGNGTEGLLDSFAKHNLWRFHRKYLLKSLGIDPMIHDWDAQKLRLDPDRKRVMRLEDFEAAGDRAVSKWTKFYRNGRVAKKVPFSGRKTLLTVKARSEEVAGGFGYLYVRLGGKIVNAIYADHPDAKPYLTLLDPPAGEYELSLEFVNDKVDRETGMDRNIWIEEVILEEEAS